MSKYMKIGEIAQKAGVTTRTVRYYEELGLIQPGEYSNGGLRLYSDFELKKLTLINDLKDLGFSLEKIKLIISEEPCDINVLKISKGEKKDFHSLENKDQKTSENFMRYLEINDQIECGNTVLQKCVYCNKKPAYINCSRCCQTLTNGNIPLILKAMF